MVPASAFLSSGAPSMKPAGELKRDISLCVSAHSKTIFLNMMNKCI